MNEKLNLTTNQKELNIVNEETVYEIGTFIDNIDKMYTFITNHLPNNQIYNEFHIEWDHSINAKAFPLQLVYTGLKHQNIDIFLSAFTPDAIQRSFMDTDNADEKDQQIQDYMQVLSKNNSLKSISFQMDKNLFGVEKNSGQLFFEYENEEKITLPFSFNVYTNHDHLHPSISKQTEYGYLINTPLNEWIQHINKEE